MSSPAVARLNDALVGRYFVATPAPQTQGDLEEGPTVVVINWFEELRRRLGEGG